MPGRRSLGAALEWGLVSLALALGGCVQESPNALDQPTVTLRAWRTPTATATPALQQPTQQATIPLGPTPTPLTHIVERGDTLLIIAAQYGVSLDELLAINPGLNPQLLSVGQALLIPGPGGEPITSLLPTSTPIPLTFSHVSCSPTATGGLTCLTAVRNPSEITLEGLSARIDLLDDRGGVLEGGIAYAPLNLLPPGELMPLSIYFEPPAPVPASARASGLTGLPANETERRYLELTIRRGDDVRSQGGSSWTVVGEVVVAPTATVPALKVQVLAVGLDAQGEVVGYAIWESAERPGPGQAAVFRVQVVSLGLPIERVALLAEALAEPAADQ
jgi:LysM repeat protein